MNTNDLMQELSSNFIEYAVAVNTDRAIPDAKSGLKPVAKRILWSAFEEGRLSSKPHVKAARIVGDVMGRYHPHGDSSIYGALVRLSQPWVMRYPLIDWHGNNGNITGDGPAAARYTEGRLSKLAEKGLLQGIKKHNVDFIANYDESLEEPVTLPTIFPNLLCNPNTGIGVAMACNWAPHNLKEVAESIYDFLDEKPVRPIYPDFPTGGMIINMNDIPKIMETGHGSVKIRARYRIEKDKIIFYEIPYGQTIEGLISEVGEKCEKKELEDILDIHDESNKKGIRIVIQFKNGTDPDFLANRIYSKTNFQTSFSYNQVALIDKTPTELNLKDAIRIYVNHNIDCIKKEASFDLNKALLRAEIVNGLLKALEDIDNIIQLIKKSESASDAKEKLIKKYNFLESQAKAILAMRLSSLAKLEKIELEKEKQQLKEKIDELNNILNFRHNQINVLKTRLKEIVDKFGDERKTELFQIEDTTKDKKEEIIPEDVVVILTQDNNIKRVSKKSFKPQKSRGKGKVSKDIISYMISTNTTDTILIFSSLGKMYKLYVNDILDNKYINIKTLLPLKNNENIQNIININNLSGEEYIYFLTKNGLIKKSDIQEYINSTRKTGIQALKIKDDDKLIAVIITTEEKIPSIVLITKNSFVIKIPIDDIRITGRTAAGQKAIKLKENDEVIQAIPSYEKENILFLTQKGKCKKTPSKDFIIQTRGGVGIKGMKLDFNDYIADAAIVKPENSIFIIGKPNNINILESSIPLQSKTGSGIQAIKGSTAIKLGII